MQMKNHSNSAKKERHDAWRDILNLFLSANRRYLLVGCILAACTALMGSLLLGISAWFITATYIAGLSAGTAFIFDVFAPSAAIRLLAIGRTASRYFERLVTHDATFTILAQLREKLFAAWAQPLALKALQLRPSRILFRLTRDLDALQVMYLRIFVPALAAIISTAIVSIVLMFMHIWLGIAVFVMMTSIGLLIAYAIARRSAHASARTMLAVERLRARTVDLVAGQTDLMMAGKIPQQVQKLHATDNRLRQADMLVNRTEVSGTWTFGLFQSCTLVVALLAGCWLMEQGTVSAAGAALIVLLIWSLCEVFQSLRLGALELGKAWVAARRLAPCLKVSSPAATMPMTTLATDQAVAVNDACFQYQASLPQTPAKPLFDHLTFNMKVGEHVAIIGPSGCGKSTLLGLISGELSAQQGTILHQPVCWLPQRTELFQDSVRGNLNLSQQPVDDATLWQILDDVALSSTIKQSQQGLDSLLGEGGLGLSGGQSRRLALGRLLLAQADFWMLDEPTEGLDLSTAQQVLVGLARHAKHKTLLIATHLQREAALAERLIVIHEGVITNEALCGTQAYEQIIMSLRND
jgi:ATP-binding cassette subfamily C protein CydC